MVYTFIRVSKSFRDRLNAIVKKLKEEEPKSIITQEEVLVRAIDGMESEGML